MAVRAYSKDMAPTASTGDGSIVRVQWTGLLNGDTGTPAPWVEWADMAFQAFTQIIATGVASVVGVGGSATLQGSNDYDPVTNPVGTWFALTSVGTGTAIAITTLGGGAQVLERPLWVRAAVTAGDGTTNCNAVLIGRRIQPQITGG